MIKNPILPFFNSFTNAVDKSATFISTLEDLILTNQTEIIQIFVIVANKFHIAMLKISEFFGIIITLKFLDNNPPHFHADYQGDKVTIEIENGK